MKSYLTTLLTFVAGFLLIVGTGGCYTQLGTTQNEEPGRYESDEYADETQSAGEVNDQYDDQAQYDYGAGYGEDWHSCARVGFDYYYPYTYWPSWGFSVAYADPWYHWYSYDPWYGSPYGSYYSPYNWGYSNWGYSGYWYNSPYYGGYYSPWYYNGYYNNAAVRPRTNREFGSTRGEGSGRSVNTSAGQGGVYRDGGTGDMVLPTASGRVTTGGTDLRSTEATGTGETSRVNGSSREGSVQSGVSRTGRDASSSTDRTVTDSDKRRIYRDRGSVTRSGSQSTGTRTATTPSKGTSTSKSAPPSGSTQRATQGSTRTRSTGTSRPAVRPSTPPRPSSSAPRPSSSSSGSSRTGTQRPRP